MSNEPANDGLSIYRDRILATSQICLTALKACLDENAIGAVKVAIDGQAYAMEGVA